MQIVLLAHPPWCTKGRMFWQKEGRKNCIGLQPRSPFYRCWPIFHVLQPENPDSRKPGFCIFLFAGEILSLLQGLQSKLPSCWWNIFYLRHSRNDPGRKWSRLHQCQKNLSGSEDERCSHRGHTSEIPVHLGRQRSTALLLNTPREFLRVNLIQISVELDLQAWLWLYFWCGIGYGTLPAGCPLLEMIQYDAFQSVHPSNPGYEDKPCVPGQGSEDFAYRCKYCCSFHCFWAQSDQPVSVSFFVVLKYANNLFRFSFSGAVRTECVLHRWNCRNLLRFRWTHIPGHRNRSYCTFLYHAGSRWAHHRNLPVSNSHTSLHADKWGIFWPCLPLSMHRSCSSPPVNIIFVCFLPPCSGVCQSCWRIWLPVGIIFA